EILAELAKQIQSNKVSRFNINRGDIWDGALRGFRRSTYNPTYTMLVKFTDDSGNTEHAIDAGGPKRQFLQLLIQDLQYQRTFEGKENEKYLRCDKAASDKTSTCDPSLEDILMFATGLRAIPPLGLQPRPTICFHHDGSLLPVANTCGNILTLPIHKTYDNFRFYVSFGILNSPGFWPVLT
ncbi:G2E3 ligase, partial [Polypterus senegalus]|nr:G2E3 ligase [Polypterus senegalus]